MTEILPSRDQDDVLPVESHRRRVGRLLVALGLTILGFAWPVPYVGYGFSVIWFVPAAVLEALAISTPRDRGSRLVGVILSLPTALGVVVGVVGAINHAVRFHGSALALLPLVAVTAAGSLVAALAGKHRVRNVWRT